MKTKIFKAILTILILISVPQTSFAQTQSINTNHYYIVNNPSPKSSNSNLIMSIVTSIISVSSILVVWFNVKRQIKSVEKNITKQFKLQSLNNIRDYISELIFEIRKPDGGKLEEKDYVSESHTKIEAKLLSYLDITKPIDKKLYDCITKFKSEIISNKNEWINEILAIENDFVKSNI